MESQGAKGLPDICPMCGGTLQLSEGGGRASCPYCGRVYHAGREAGGLGGVLEGLKRRAGIVAANYGLTAAGAASDSFEGDLREAERRFAACAETRNGCAVSCRARVGGEQLRAAGVAEVGKKAAYADPLLGRISFAPEVAVIGKKAFARCGQLTAVRLEGVRSLGARAFAGCPALREVTIARHIPQAGRKAFAKCGSVARVFLPRSMEPQIGRLFGRLAKLRIEFVFFGE